MDRRPPEISTLLLLVAVELRGFLFREERLEDKNLAETDEEDGDSHECRPNHDPLIQAFGAFAALQFVKLCVVERLGTERSIFGDEGTHSCLS